MIRFRLSYALAALVVFVVEICIALYLHDDLVRPYLGDSLAVVLVYLGLRAVTPWRVLPALIVALALAIAIELGQFFHMIDVLGLRGNRIAGFVLGGYFDIRDLACYALGAACVLALESLRKQPLS